jgi:hypothetical protein
MAKYAFGGLHVVPLANTPGCQTGLPSDAVHLHSRNIISEEIDGVLALHS